MKIDWWCGVGVALMWLNRSTTTLNSMLQLLDIYRLLLLFVRTYVFHLLIIYVILLCNWLIFWQNALYLYLGRSRMCLTLQETCCSSLVLKPWRLDQETSEEKLFIKVWQIARQLRIDSSTASRHLSIDFRALNLNTSR